PDVFACALLNSQPMGFYAPAQIVRDARDHDVEVRPVDVNFSLWDCTLELPGNALLGGRASFPIPTPGVPAKAGTHSSEARAAEWWVPAFAGTPVESDPRFRESDHTGVNTRCALRLGLRQIKGFAEADAERLVTARGAGYRDARDLWHRSGLGRAALERLAEADTLRSLDLDRRRGLWALKALGDAPLPLFAAANPNVIPGRPEGPGPEPMNTDGKAFGKAGDEARQSRCSWVPGSLAALGPRNDNLNLPSSNIGQSETRAASLLPEMPLGEHVVEEYASLGLTIKRHPLAFLRAELAAEGLATAADLATLPIDRRLAIAGLVLIRQRPGSANGVVFITLEDETRLANLIAWPAGAGSFRR